MLKITLVKSLIGQVPKNVKTAHALGLRKIGNSTIQNDTSSIRGMIHHVKHVLKVEEVEDQPIVRKRRFPKAVAEAKAAKAPVKEVAVRVAKPKVAKPVKEAKVKAVKPAKAAKAEKADKPAKVAKAPKAEAAAKPAKVTKAKAEKPAADEPKKTTKSKTTKKTED